MKITAELVGVPKAITKFKLLDQVVRNEILKGVQGGAQIVQKRAKENISGMHGHVEHVLTGTLRRSFQVRVGWKSFTEVVGAIGTDVPYAPYVEALPDGGSLVPALNETGKDAYDYIKLRIILAIKGTGVS